MSSRAKRRGNKQHKEQRQQQKEPKPTRKSLWQWIGLLSPNGKIATAIALFLTVAGSYYTFSPKLVISASDTLNPQEPFATKFDVKNESLFKVQNITFKYKPRDIVFTGGGSVVSKGGFLNWNKEPIPFLESGETTSLLLPKPPYSSPVAKADIELHVSYRPAFLPFEKHKAKRFVTSVASDGSLHWMEKAISE